MAGGRVRFFGMGSSKESLIQDQRNRRILSQSELRTVPTNSKVFLPRFMIMQEM